jgi:DNA-binding transcriptional LysR family regulator
MSDVLVLFKTFVRTVEAGSFTAVARDLNSSQPTISRQIAVLEDHLGCVLFQRTTRALTLTDDGRVFYAHAQRTLEAAQEAESAVGRRRSKPSGVLKLACAGVFGRLHIVPRLKRFRARYPEIDIALMMSDGFSDLVEEGIDLAIRVGPIDGAALITRRIGLSRRVAVASPDYVAAHGRPQHPRDLEQHECVVYDKLLAGAHWNFVTPDGPVSVAVKGSIHVNNTEGVRAAILHGLGIGYVPVWHFADGETVDGRVEVLLGDYETDAQPISAVYPSRRFLAPKVRAMIDFLVTEFGLDPQLSSYGA